jgi:hypothetical protein
MLGGGDIPPSSQKTADSGILDSPHESIRRTQADARQDFCPSYGLTAKKVCFRFFSRP